MRRKKKKKGMKQDAELTGVVGSINPIRQSRVVMVREREIMLATPLLIEVK